ALGIAKSYDSGFELSVEAFYKKMRNVISYEEGASFFTGFASDWQTKITQGDGESYGFELFLQKKKGRTTGWLGYTLAWNNRTFPFINGGEKFPFRFDRRHDISLVLSHELSKKVSFSAAWVYGTGNAISLSTGQFQESPYFTIEVLGDKNAFRMSDYHRLDISLEFYRKKPKWERKWILSVYNTYWHRNPYYIISDTDIDPNTGEEKRVLKEISVLPIIPSIAYSFKF
ncbi:MAG: TonB-dependent receptor, partial [Bacteroidota bacterium]